MLAGGSSVAGTKCNSHSPYNNFTMDRIAIYDVIGQSYSEVRRADLTILNRLKLALAPAAGRRLLDIAAGTGNYSFALARLGWDVTALEPSAAMRAQRKLDSGRVTWVAAIAEELPFRRGAFDAVVCVSAMHHLKDRPRAFAEFARMASGGPVVLFTRDPRAAEPCWMEQYFPEVWARSHSAYPETRVAVAEMRAATGRDVHIDPLDLPANLSDLFAAAGWNRPEIYLDERIRAGMSPFAQTSAPVVNAQVEQLRRDLASGIWDERYGELRKRPSFPAGYYLLIAV